MSAALETGRCACASCGSVRDPPRDAKPGPGAADAVRVGTAADRRRCTMSRPASRGSPGRSPRCSTAPSCWRNAVLERRRGAGPRGRRGLGQLAPEPDRRGRAQHPPARHPRAAQRRRCRPRSPSTRRVQLAHWFGGARAPGVRQRRAGPRSRIHSDVCEHPARQLAGRAQSRTRAAPRSTSSRSSAGWRARGHRVRLVCSGWPDAPARDVGARASRCTRVGGRHTFALSGARRGAPGACGGTARRGVRGHQQAPALPRRPHRPAVLRHRPAPVRQHGVRGGARGPWRAVGVAGGAAAAAGLSRVPGFMRSARAPGTTWSPAAWRRERFGSSIPAWTASGTGPTRRWPGRPIPRSCMLGG